MMGIQCPISSAWQVQRRLSSIPITSNSTELYARFITDGSGVEQGFVARYACI